MSPTWDCPRLEATAHWRAVARSRLRCLQTRVNMQVRELSGARVIILLTFDTQADVDAAVSGYQAGAGHWSNGAVLELAKLCPDSPQ